MTNAASAFPTSTREEVPDAGAGVKQNGLLTQGEDTADNGGIHLALIALEAALKKQGKSLDEKGPDGWTYRQRFFLSYAYSWCSNVRPEVARLIVTTEPALDAHLPHRQRGFEYAGVCPGVWLQSWPEDGPGERLPGLVRQEPMAARWTASPASLGSCGNGPGLGQ